MKKIYTLLTSCFIILMLSFTSLAAPINSTNPVQTVSIKAVGDDLIHAPLYKIGEANGSNYDFMFANIKDEISKADIAIINQETMFVPGNYSSYPCFGSPLGIGKAMIDAGFDVATCATNHSLDRGLTGINTTIDFFKSNADKITFTGLNASEEEYNTIKTITRNGITFALLNYTYGTNGIPVPKDAPWCVNILNDEEKVVNDIKKAKEISDVVIVFPHWGTEYVYKPDSFQTKWTDIFLENGVDIVIGTHPHVVEPMAMLKSSTGHDMLVYYSLGNFISSQSKVPRCLGAMADIVVSKDKSGNISIDKCDIVPLVTHQSSSVYTTFLLKDYPKELENMHRLGAKKDYLQELFDQILLGTAK